MGRKGVRGRNGSGVVGEGLLHWLWGIDAPLCINVRNLRCVSKNGHPFYFFCDYSVCC